jgi:uncharacterized Zn finger protein (UPF0148 family)
MLQMNCPKCDGLVKSPLLAELQTIECPSCRATVDVRNVVVSTRNFSMQRDDLTDRISHYKKMLRDVEKEIQAGLCEESMNEKKRKSAAGLRASLKDLLLAARDNFRLNMTYDLYVQINFGNIKRFARLLNISSTGAGIELVSRGQLPENNAEITFQLLLPGYAEPLSLPAKVIWSRKPVNEPASQSVNMGVKFADLDKDTRACIWGFIVDSETSAQP